MSEEHKDTKQAIIEAAGELFAESGVDAVGIRTIAEKAGVNIAAVNYHFGNKENLSVEIFRYIVTRSCKRRIPDIIEALGESPSRAELAAAIRGVIEAMFETFVNQGNPDWHDRYSLRVLLRPAEPFHQVMKEHFLPEHEALKRLALLARPGLDEDRATALALSFNAHAAFYFLAREPLELMLGDRFDRGYFQNAVKQVVSTYLSAFGLGEYAS